MKNNDFMYYFIYYIKLQSFSQIIYYPHVLTQIKKNENRIWNKYEIEIPSKMKKNSKIKFLAKDINML